MPNAVATKTMNEGLLNLDDQWSNNLTAVNQLDTIPTGEYDPSVVLCTLEGILADFSEETRNNRWYSERLWNRVINSDEFKELEATKTLFGESDHPMDIEDRFDVHYNYVSHCVRDVEIDRANQCVKGKIDVLDTPAGRIIFTFVKYGSTLGVSSRGAGDLIDVNGHTEVDPDTYQFYAWDIVHRPANRKARMRVSESVNNTPTSQLENLVESAKSDKNSLKWIKSLVESTNIQEKDKVLGKINEYVDMLNGDEDPLSDVIIAKDKTISQLKDDLLAASTEIIRLRDLLKDKDNSNSSVDTSQMEELLNKYDISANLLESIDKKVSKKPKASVDKEYIGEVGEAILDRIDEAYANLMKMIVSVKKPMNSVRELLKNDETVITEGFRSIRSQLKESQSNTPEVIVDDSVKADLEKALSQNSELKSQNESLDSRVKTLLAEKLESSKQYLSLRCTQLGINESAAYKKLGNLLEYTFDDIDDHLSEMYKQVGTRRQSSSLKESEISSMSMVSKAPMTEKKADAIDDGGLLALIQENISV